MTDIILFKKIVFWQRFVSCPTKGKEDAIEGSKGCWFLNPRMELLSPSKGKDRPQNVTEKVTQV